MATADLSQVAVSMEGSGIVHTRVSFSLVCQSPAEADNDHSTTPI
jgi:hypothetical protein